MKFNDWLRQKRGGSTKESDSHQPPYYEDTHDSQGNYIGDNGISSVIPQANQATSENIKYGNIAVYRPKSLKDVERFITFLRGGEPAVANLNDIDEDDAQRILDYLSGAIFALAGSVHRITDNIFVFSPKGTQIHS